MASFEKQTSSVILTFIVLAVVLIASGLHWSLFYLLFVGLIFSLFSILSLILYIANRDEDVTFGCILVVVVFILVSIFIFGSFGLKKERFINSGGKKIHLFQDCSSLSESKEVKEVSLLEAYVRGRFSNCKVCKKMKADKEEAERQRIEKEVQQWFKSETENKKKELRKFYLDQLKQLKTADDIDIDIMYDEYKRITDDEYEEYDEEVDIDPSDRITHPH